jgi:predicted phosphodiesterase
MRYGVISDVHGNLHALEAALDAVEAAGVDRLICPGDVVGYGPRPNECAARIASLGALAVAGNHDLMALGELPVEGLPRLQRDTIEWTRAVIDDSTRDYLARLPATVRTGEAVTIAHGSLDDPTEYVRDCTLGGVQLGRLVERDPDARGLLLGHTHHPLACARTPLRDYGDVVALTDEPWLLNAGAVGQSREPAPVARAGVIDLDRGEVRLLALEYDVAATRRELRDAGLPPHAVHLAPGRAARWRRRAWELTHRPA